MAQVPWGRKDDGLFLGFGEKPHSGLFGRVVAGGFQEQQEDQRDTGMWRGGDQRETGQSTLGLFGLCFAFDGKSLKYFEHMSGMM